MKRTYYSVLHVLHHDPPETIREAYKRVRKLHEPGLLAHDKAIIAEAKLAKEAFDTLIDPERRAAYDNDMALTTTSIAVASAIEVRQVPFWTPVRIIVWGAMLVLVVFAIFYRPNKPVDTNPTPYFKNPDAAAPKQAEPQPAADALARPPAPTQPPADTAPNRK